MKTFLISMVLLFAVAVNSKAQSQDCKFQSTKSGHDACN